MLFQLGWFPLGSTDVTVLSVDSSGNTASCSFVVSVLDPALSLQCPSSTILPTDPGLPSRNFSWLPAFVNASFAPCVQIAPSGFLHPWAVLEVGTTPVTYVATSLKDSSIFYSCTFNVTIVDTEAPVITDCPSSMSVCNSVGLPFYSTSWHAPTAVDNVGVTSSLSNYVLPEANFSIGSSVVSYSFSDAANNVAVCSFTVVVADCEPPKVLFCPANITVRTEIDEPYATVSWSPPVFSDNVAVTNETGPADSATVMVSLNGATQFLYTARDAAGHSTLCAFYVTVQDDQPPVISGCPSVPISGILGPSASSIQVIYDKHI